MPESPSQHPLTAIVSVTYNRCNPLLLLLSQLKTLNYPPDCFDIYLVDNASTDDTVAQVKKKHGDEIILIQVDENMGSSAGFNRGMDEALKSDRPYKYIWLLDSDAEVEDQTLIKLIESCEADSNIGIIGSTVYAPDKRDRIIARGLQVNWDKGTVSLNKEPATLKENLTDVDLIPACSLLVKIKLCRELGLWDERFWLYWGDTDWCQRAIRNGYRVCCHMQSRVWHRDWANTRRNFSSPLSIYDDLRGGILFNLRHNPKGSLSGARHLILKNYVRGALEYLTMRPNFSDACNTATRDFLKADFKRSNLYAPSEEIAPIRLEETSAILKKMLTREPQILFTRIENTAAQRFEKYLSKVFPKGKVKQEVSVRASTRENFTTNYPHYFKHELRKLITSVFKPRYHLLVTDIGEPHFNTLMSARHTVFIDSAGRAVICRNRPLKGILGMMKMLVKGMLAAYIVLPMVMKNSPPVQLAINDYNEQKPVSGIKAT